YTEGARKQKDPPLPTGTEKVPDASDKTLKSTECKETQRETEIRKKGRSFQPWKNPSDSDIRKKTYKMIRKGLEKGETQDRPKDAI
ncbi:hypothetical protein, partial [Faecalibaculum rodentium]|uniref:hypothetical protein n=1 Tax=Faecalibaculum rodentium TaxID=1702221 RepID=UPI0026298071